jgi:hypothetical protein
MTEVREADWGSGEWEWEWEWDTRCGNEEAGVGAGLFLVRRGTAAHRA